ncbi:MAG TPA: hypothetical protein VFE53_26460 [Mucilaginibacter sp.]|jgi:hypothetical protein|nr:hypothetical protein [Mucilaginibacter sp.]
MKNSSRCKVFRITCFIFFTFICFTGCKKDKAPIPYYPLPADGLAYIQFNPGKYFIYKDSAANKIDSVIVTESSLSGTSGVSGSLHDYTSQQYTLVLTEAAPVSGLVWLSGTAPGNLPGAIDLAAPDGHFIFQYFTINPAVPSIIPTMPIPSIVVEGKTYTNIVLTLSAGPGGNSYFYYYWAKGLGLIKRIETKTGGPVTDTYTLLRNN